MSCASLFNALAASRQLVYYLYGQYINMKMSMDLNVTSITFEIAH